MSMILLSPRTGNIMLTEIRKWLGFRGIDVKRALKKTFSLWKCFYLGLGVDDTGIY